MAAVQATTDVTEPDTRVPSVEVVYGKCGLYVACRFLPQSIKWSPLAIRCLAVSTLSRGESWKLNSGEENEFRSYCLPFL